MNPNLALIASLLALAVPARAEEFDCLIEAAQTVELRSPVAGLLQAVHVRRGDSLRRGQLLVSIESSVEQSAEASARFRAQAQGQLELARQKVGALRDKVRRLDELQAEEFVAPQAAEDARAELKLAEAEQKTALESQQLARLEHRQSEDQLRRRQLFSPFDGVVVDQYLNPGALVDGGEGRKPILKIAQIDPLRVQALLPLRLFPRLKPGQAVQVTPEAPFNNALQARLRTVDRVIDAAAGTVGIVAEIANGKQQLPAGLRCKLKL
jgi:RND family efflux transporter MFP subunit